MRVCVYWGHSPFPEPMQSPRPPLGPGIPSPRAEIPARPLPTLPRRESGRAGDKETPASSTLGPSALPRHSPAPSLDPCDVSRGHSGEGGTGGRVCSLMRASWRLPVLPAQGHPTAAAPHPPLTKPSRAQGTATPNQNRPPPLQQSCRGARRTQSRLAVEGGGEYPGGRDPARALHGPALLFTRFLLRSRRCLRR